MLEGKLQPPRLELEGLHGPFPRAAAIGLTPDGFLNAACDGGREPLLRDQTLEHSEQFPWGHAVLVEPRHLPPVRGQRALGEHPTAQRDRTAPACCSECRPELLYTSAPSSLNFGVGIAPGASFQHLVSYRVQQTQSSEALKRA